MTELMQIGIDVSKRGEVDLLKKITVRDIMKTDHEIVSHKTGFRQLMDVILNSRYGDVFVVNDREELVGIISLRDIRQAISDQQLLLDLLIAGDLALPVVPVPSNDTVSSAMMKIEDISSDCIPVIEPGESARIIGMLRMSDIITAYNTLLEEWETSQFLLQNPK
jgi:CIC family chloride channel protein